MHIKAKFCLFLSILLLHTTFQLFSKRFYPYSWILFALTFSLFFFVWSRKQHPLQRRFYSNRIEMTGKERKEVVFHPHHFRLRLRKVSLLFLVNVFISCQFLCSVQRHRVLSQNFYGYCRREPSFLGFSNFSTLCSSSRLCTSFPLYSSYTSLLRDLVFIECMDCSVYNWMQLQKSVCLFPSSCLVLTKHIACEFPCFEFQLENRIQVQSVELTRKCNSVVFFLTPAPLTFVKLSSHKSQLVFLQFERFLSEIFRYT